MALVTFTVGSEVFHSRALALPGDYMDWTAVLSMKVT